MSNLIVDTFKDKAIPTYSENAVNIYKKLYFCPELGETSIEQVHRRIAKALSNTDEEYETFLVMLNHKLFRPNTPVFINAGVNRNNDYNNIFSACHVFGLEDTMESIIDLWGTAAKIYAGGAGIGFNGTKLRGVGKNIKSGGIASGPLEYAKVLDIISNTVKAGNRSRRASNMLVINHNHEDTLNLITSKLDGKTLQNFNLSVLTPDSFMEVVEYCLKDNNIDLSLDFDMYLECPNEGKMNKTISVMKLWNTIVENCWKNGDPGLIFYDTVNNLNPFPSKVITSTNPCVTKNTLILTKKGYVPISSVVNEETTIWNGYEWSKVTPRVTGVNQPVLTIKFSNGEVLTCTHYHNFKLKNGEEKQAKDLIIGDKLEKWNYPVIHSGEYYKEAYTQGIFAGDGTFSGGNSCVWLYDKKKELLKYIDYKKANEYKDLRINVYLDKNVYTNKVFIPDINWNVQSRLEFLAGLADTDGCVLFDGGIQITSTKKLFLKKLQLMLSTLGCHSYVTLLNKRGFRKLPKNDGTNERKLYKCRTVFRLTISSFNVLKLIDLGFKTHRLNLEHINPNRDASRFISVKEIINDNKIEDKVYCFSEPKNHTGIFNGIMTGQCGEVAMWDWTTCILGSININAFFIDNHYNFPLLNNVVKYATIFLNNAIDKSAYVHPLFEKTMKENRPIGLGIMGVADYLIQREIPYDSEEAKWTLSQLMKFINAQSILTSINIAKNDPNKKIKIPKEDYEYFLSKYLPMFLEEKDIEIVNAYGIANCVNTCIAPTGSISISCDCSHSWEPLFGLCWEKKLAKNHENKQETMTFLNTQLLDKLNEHLKEYKLEHADNIIENLIIDIKNNHGSLQGLASKYNFPAIWEKIFKVAHDIDPYKKIELQGELQKNIGMAISGTVNLPNSATEKDISNLFLHAWKNRVKGITVYRDGCREWQPVNFGKIKEDKIKESKIELSSSRPIKTIGATYKIKTPYGDLYITCNSDTNNKPLEVFLELGKCGQHENLLYNTIATCISHMLRKNIDVKHIVDKIFTGRKSEKLYFKLDEDQEIPYSAESIVEAIGITMQKHFNNIEIPKEEYRDNRCPECYAILQKNGCRNGGICPDCGYSSCS